jgi:hypothetical protein
MKGSFIIIIIVHREKRSVYYSHPDLYEIHALDHEFITHFELLGLVDWSGKVAD